MNQYDADKRRKRLAKKGLCVQGPVALCAVCHRNETRRMQRRFSQWCSAVCQRADWEWRFKRKHSVKYNTAYARGNFDVCAEGAR